MISTADFKNGLTISFDKEIFQIVEFQHVKPGKGHLSAQSCVIYALVQLLSAPSAPERR